MKSTSKNNTVVVFTILRLKHALRIVSFCHNIIVICNKIHVSYDICQFVLTGGCTLNFLLLLVIWHFIEKSNKVVIKYRMH